MNRPSTPAIVRVERRLVVTDLGYLTPCRIATGKLDQGYARVRLGDRDSETRRAHRVVWEFHNGPIPDGMTVDHLCHPGDGSCPGGRDCPHRACCEITHLGLAPNTENVLRGVGITAENARKTHCIRNHELTDENVYLRHLSDGRLHRACKACRNQRERDKRAHARIGASHA